MLRILSVFLLTLLLVGCAGRPDFDVRTQPIQYKDLEGVKAEIGRASCRERV